MQALNQYLRENGIRQQVFADRCGVSQPTMSRLVRGTAQPSAELAKRIEQETNGAIRFYDWPAFAVFAPTPNEQRKEA